LAFVPKIVTVFAQSIPLAVMSSFGYVESNLGVSYAQPYQVKQIVQLFFIGCPVLFSIISLYIKSTYPISHNSQLTLIKETISYQKAHYPSLAQNNDYIEIPDPIYTSKRFIFIFKNSNDLNESKTIELCDIFDSKHELNYLYLNKFNDLKSTITIKIIVYTISIAVLFVLEVLTFGLLSNKALSIFPVITLLVISILIIFLIYEAVKLKMIENVIAQSFVLNYDMINLITYKNTGEIEGKEGIEEECGLCWKECCGNKENKEEKI